MSTSSAAVASSITITGRPLDQQARDGDALALAARQDLLPALGLVEPVGEMAEAGGLQRLDGLRRRRACRRRRDRPARRAAGRAARRCAPARRRPWRRRGIWMRPSPHGHKPAIARTSVLLPVPDSPPSSTRSPGRDVELGVGDHHPAVAMHDREVRRCGSSLSALFSILIGPTLSSLSSTLTSSSAT